MTSTKEYNKEYYQKNKAKLQKASLKYYHENNSGGGGAARQKSKRAADPNHKEKAREYAKRYREGNDQWKRYKRNSDLKKRYGITIEDYEVMLTEQQHKCALCLTDDPGAKRWCVDHCHNSTKVRAILCRPCNLALGAANDDPDLLRRMAAYVEQHQKGELPCARIL